MRLLPIWRGAPRVVDILLADDRVTPAAAAGGD
jgi:hypothetical protein